MLVFGTRPEAIKMAPLVHELKKYPDFFEVIVTVTGQHREMLDQVLTVFDIVPDYDLNIMKPNQDLFDVSCKVLMGLRPILKSERPDFMMVHGDTTTSTFASIAAFYEKIRVCHVEAGLRTYDLGNPWPEEMNRQLTGRLATFHFAPTEKSKENLMQELVDEQSIIVTGNTVIDALKIALKRIEENQDIADSVEHEISEKGYPFNKQNRKKIVLITGHRRENFGDSFLEICEALKQLAMKYPDVDFVYPMHLNPNIRNPIKKFFENVSCTNIYFIEPLNYLPFIYMMSQCNLVLTDSGGIQEEAPSLKKPVLVMRNTTERPESLTAGSVKLVGTKSENIIIEISKLLTDQVAYDSMTISENPYGDGEASSKISNFLKHVK